MALSAWISARRDCASHRASTLSRDGVACAFPGANRGSPIAPWTRRRALFGKALRAADAVADAETAAMLLRPSRIEDLTETHVNSFAKIADRYGQRGRR